VRGIPLSTHLLPEVSLHMMAVSPTAHWLEYVDWPECFLARRPTVKDGKAQPIEAPGIGVQWDEDAVAKLEI